MTTTQQTAPPVLAEILDERFRQDAKWGEQNHPDGTGPDWPIMAMGTTFCAEARDKARAMCQAAAGHGTVTWHHILAEEFHEGMADEWPANLRAELVQAAAVCVAWIEAIDRRGAQP